MSNRSLAGSTVTLVREGTQGRTARTFRVLQEYRRGSTVICYTARPEEGGPVGVLREFCPQDTDTKHYVMRRGTDHFLYTAGNLPAANENFCTSRDEYTAAYHRLSRSEQLREDELLQSFIPTFEIYYSEAEHSGYNGTVYIWTDRLLKTFAELCEEIQKQPSSRPEYFLALVLNAVCTLTECVRALHAAGFIHRDIKPSNFGFARREDRVLTQTLTLFDIDSIWNTEDPMGPVVGTEGYMAPETLKSEPDNRADIYSIGATLFSAIIITDRARENGFRYTAEFYDELEQMVDESALIRASEQNSHPRLRQILTKILRGCLNADKKQRYRNCRYLINDLNEALSYVLPPELALRSRAGERWVLTDGESAFDRVRRRNSVRLFRYRLYERPLYRSVKPDENDIRVLTIGLGNYGQRYIDVILSLCQLPGKRVDVSALSAELSDLSLYLKDRPMLREFIAVNGAAVSEEKFCGSLHTITRRLELTRPNENTETALTELLRRIRPHQIFLALGNENMNLAGAKLCGKLCRKLGQSSEIAFVWDDEVCTESLPENVAPIYVNADTGKMAVHTEIEQMAFNLYALQRRDEELGRSRLKKEFGISREHENAVAQVAAVRYMLWSIGIDPSACASEEAAADFAAMNKADPGLRAVLGQAEHRRRVMEKVCAGWTRMQRFQSDGAVKNERKKQHLCLVGSRVNEGLPKKDLFLWEQAPEEDLQQLDELDRLSVHMHRYYAEQAENTGTAASENSTTEAVRRMIGESGEASAAFLELCCCMQDIAAGDRDKVRFYRGLCNAFLKTLQALPDENERNARRLFAEVQRGFAPTAESARFRDLKKDAEQVADAIPYILTYTAPTLAVPFCMGNSTAVFSNAAAAIVAEPEKIFYLCCIRDAAAEEFCQAVSAVLRVLKRKHLQPGLELLIAYSCTGPNGWKERLADRLTKAAEGFSCKVRLLHTDEEGEMADAFTDVLAERRARHGRMIAERNDSPLSELLERAGFYARRAMYRFDSLRMEFTDCRRCGWLRYIRTDRCITAGDLISLGRETGSIEIQPQFVRSYRELWKRYREDPAVWRTLCGILAEAAEKYDTLVCFSRPDDAAERKQYRYILPAECMAAAEKLLELFRKAGIVKKDHVCSCDALNGEAVFLAPVTCEDAMDELFGDPLLLLQKEEIFFRGDNEDTIAVCLDHREIRDIACDKISAEQRALLEYFREAGFIIRLRKHDGRIAFTCATRQGKRLLTSAERILEIYTYRKLKETVGFDDVRAGIHLHRIGTVGEEQLDMAVSRGFSSMIVECRDVSRISPAYCAEFSRMAEQAGVNSKAVLIADECAGLLPAEITASERIPNVSLITHEKDISDIGHVLLRLMSKK